MCKSRYLKKSQKDSEDRVMSDNARRGGAVAACAYVIFYAFAMNYG